MNLLIWPLISFLLPFVASLEHLEVELGQGYEGASLNWNIAGPAPDEFPNVLSELKWEDLKIWDSRAFIALHKGCFVLRCEGNYGKIFDGYNIDNDYGKDDRKAIFSHARATADCGEVFDITATMGYEISCLCVSFIPYGGWARDEQHLNMKSPATFKYNGNNNPFEPVNHKDKGKIKGLNSRYNTRWEGALAGCDVACHMGCFSLFGGFEYHWLDYKAHAHWNLREDFVEPFLHEGKGHGTKIRLGASLDLTCNCDLGILATITDYRIKNGRDKTTLLFQNDPVVVHTKLNDVRWHAYTLIANLGIRF